MQVMSLTDQVPEVVLMQTETQNWGYQGWGWGEEEEEELKLLFNEDQISV